MKTINNTNRAVLLGIGILGATTLVGFATPASAQPRRDVKSARKDVKAARKDVRRANTPEARRDAREDLRGEKKDLREEKRENRPGNAYGRPNSGSNFGRSYTGTVTNVRSSQSFDVNIGGNTFNVYTTSRTPRGLSTGDTVRVNGLQQYNNDIRDASVSVIRNR